MMLGVGGILMALSPYLTWVSVAGFVNVDLFGLVRLASYKQMLAYAPVILGLVLVGSVVISLAYVPVLRALAITYSLMLPILGGLAITKLYRAVTSSQGALHFGIGFIALGAAEVMFIVAGLYPSQMAIDTKDLPDQMATATNAETGLVRQKQWPPHTVEINSSSGTSAREPGSSTQLASISDTPASAPARWCDECNRELDAGFVFCPKCGTATSAIGDDRCEECEGPVEKDDDFCHSCGHELI